jgi:ribosomal protein L40E
MKGALVFLAVFIVVLAVTVQYTDLPPAKEIYKRLEIPETTHPVQGIPATTWVLAVFNGVVYGVVAWLIYSIADKATKKKPQPEKATKPTVQREEKKFCISCRAEISAKAKYCTKCGAAQ